MHLYDFYFVQVIQKIIKKYLSIIKQIMPGSLVFSMPGLFYAKNVRSDKTMMNDIMCCRIKITICINVKKSVFSLITIHI